MDKRAVYRSLVERSLSGTGEVRGTWEALFDQLEKTKFLSVAVNRTGNVTLLRLKAPQGRREIRLQTGAIRINGPLPELVDKLLSASIHDFGSFTTHFSSNLGWVGGFGDVAGDIFLKEARRRGISLLDDACAAIASSAAAAKQAGYQLQLSLQRARAAIKAAFQLGASRDDLELAVAEELVRSVSDS